MANLNTYPDEIEEFIHQILYNENMKHELILSFAKMTEVEQRKMLKQINDVYYSALATLEKCEKQESIILLKANFFKNTYNKLCLSIANFRLHKNLLASEIALRETQRKIIKTNTHIKKTAKQKILSVIVEIHEMRGKNIKWKDIIYWLKTSNEHRKMFYAEKLDERNVRRIYSEWLDPK